MMWIIIIFSLLALILIGVKLSKEVLLQFGAKPIGQSNERIQESKNFKNGKFRNLEDKAMMTKSDFTAIIKYFSNSQDKIPRVSLPVERVDINSLKAINGENIKLIWFGHSTVLLEVDNKKILLDPMLSEVPAPLPMLVSKRFSRRIPLEIIDFPELDAVLISHDHYDHLDYVSIIKLKDRVKMFYVPLGIGAHLKSWGVEPAKIIELDWWQESKLEELTFIATPSHHFSGRGLFNRDSTLWCSWVIKSKHSSIFFSGDTGYHKAFKEIGEKYGPFDLNLLECGQYDEGWAHIHMMPEETVQANIDLKGKILMPIHWGAFKLSVHPWYEPVERLLKEANSLKVNVITPKIGEIVSVGKSVEFEKWWRYYK
jgi:L-ascorbate metabolism protein UlaG (beta-lactamase superfamily)